MAIIKNFNAISTNKKQFSILTLIVLAGLCASILIFKITNHGPGVSPDSTLYIGTANNLLAGNGFFIKNRPITEVPPVYPLMLAGAGLFQNGDILQAGRLIGALLFGINIFLIGFAVQISTEHSWVATICAIFIVLCSAPTLYIHSMAWSEAPFVMFSLAAFILVSLYIARPSLYLLLFAACMTGLAIGTRYVGVTLLPPIVFALIFFGVRPIKHKIQDVFIVSIIAFLPLSFWFARNIAIAQAATDRTIAIHLFDFHHMESLINTMYEFVLPIPVSSWVKTLFFCVSTVLFLLALILLRKKNQLRRNATSSLITLPVIFIVFFLTYIAFLVFSISFFDAHTPLDNRILLPAFLALIIASTSLAWSLSQTFKQRFIWYSFFFFALLSIALNAQLAIPTASEIHKEGIGYTSQYWQNSETISHLADASIDKKIYSNGPEIIQFLTDKDAVMIPNKAFPLTRTLNQNYEKQLHQVSEESRKGKAIIVYLDGASWRWYLPSVEEFEAKGNLPILQRFKDGVIYGENPGNVNDN